MDETLEDLMGGLDISKLLATVTEIREKSLKHIDKALTPEVRASMSVDQLNTIDSTKSSFSEGFDDGDLTENLNKMTKIVSDFEDISNRTKKS